MKIFSIAYLLISLAIRRIFAKKVIV